MRERTYRTQIKATQRHLRSRKRTLLKTHCRISNSFCVKRPQGRFDPEHRLQTSSTPSRLSVAGGLPTTVGTPCTSTPTYKTRRPIRSLPRPPHPLRRVRQRYQRRVRSVPPDQLARRLCTRLLLYGASTAATVCNISETDVDMVATAISDCGSLVSPCRDGR